MSDAVIDINPMLDSPVTYPPMTTSSVDNGGNLHDAVYQDLHVVHRVNRKSHRYKDTDWRDVLFMRYGT
jgi:hypothetical protein